MMAVAQPALPRAARPKACLPTIDLGVQPAVTVLFEEATNAVSDVVKDPTFKARAIVDSLMDIDWVAGRIASDHGDAMAAFVRSTGPPARG